MLSVLSGWLFVEKRKLVQVFPEEARKIWDLWELRILVLISLTLQISLIVLGNRRKYNPNTLLRLSLLQLKGNVGSKRQHVHGCSLVRNFYGYHSSEEIFFEITSVSKHYTISLRVLLYSCTRLRVCLLNTLTKTAIIDMLSPVLPIFFWCIS